MAEILISLTIIGVIAAITLPSLQANINEKTWATQRKALYSRMSQAIEMMPSLNGYGVAFNNDGTLNVTDTANKATETFISDGLSKVLKISNICNYSKITDCAISSKIKNFKGDNITIPTTFYGMFSKHVFPAENYINTKTAAFETANGESVLTYYNPNCNYFDINNIDYTNTSTDDNFDNYLPSMCVNFIYDLNGKKGPNKVGKDIGYITVLSPTESIVSTALLYSKSVALGYNDAVNYCRSLVGGYRLPTIYDFAAIDINNKIIYKSTSGVRFWALSKTKDGLPITVYIPYGHIRSSIDLSIRFAAWCVKR